MNIVCE